MKGSIGIVLVLLGFLAAAGALAWWGWRELGDVPISGHGWVALALGAGVTFFLGAGLMWLVFYSHRRGYDDRVGRD